MTARSPSGRARLGGTVLALLAVALFLASLGFGGAVNGLEPSAAALLQTSEGPNATYPKLQVAGELVGRKRVSHDEAHPKPHPRTC